LLILEWIFIVFSFDIAIIFLFKYYKQPKQLKDKQDLGFSILFFGFSFMRFFFMISSFYFSDVNTTPFLIWSIGNYRKFFLNLGFLSITLGILFCTFFIETNKKFIVSKYFFTIYYSLIFLFITFLFLINLDFLNLISIFIWPFFVPSFLFYIRDFGIITKKQGILKNGFLKITIILTQIFIGYILSLDFVVEVFGFLSRIIGIVLQLIAIGFIFFFFRNIPPFFEFDWQDKIENIFLINNDGICLHNYSYDNKNEQTELDNQFITGTLTSMNILLEELFSRQSNEISIVEKKGKVLTIFSGKYITGIIISKEELKFFRHNIKKLVLKVEEIYKNVLIQWDGDLSSFLPVKNIINEIFLK
jgi:hypothetical protein